MIDFGQQNLEKILIVSFLNVSKKLSIINHKLICSHMGDTALKERNES